MPRKRRATARRQDCETVVQAFREFGERNGGDSGRRKFEGERNPVKPLTNFDYVWYGFLIEREAGVCSLSTIDKKRDRSVARRLVCSQSLRLVGQRNRRYSLYNFAHNSERLSRSCKDGDIWALMEDLVGKLGGCVEHVLAVVENDERPSPL